MDQVDELKELAAAHGFELFVTEHHEQVRLEARPVGGRLRRSLIGYGTTVEQAAGRVIAEIRSLPV